jgi:hypothetical protein
MERGQVQPRSGNFGLWEGFDEAFRKPRELAEEFLTPRCGATWDENAGAVRVSADTRAAFRVQASACFFAGFISGKLKLEL